MKVRARLKILSRLVTVLGVVVTLLHLRGCFQDQGRADLLRLVLAAGHRQGVTITHPTAAAFMKRFPPPPTTNMDEITHIIKMGMVMGTGYASAMPFAYLLRGGAVTKHVADLDEVRSWASESSYPWAAWWITLVGIITVLGVDLSEWRERHATH